jgi:RNA polymerase sigma-70 factor (ECF subfamily)
MLAELKRFVFDLLDREKALKRGGGVEFEPLPDDSGTGLLKDKRSLSADVCFDMAWAKVLVDRALDRLQKAYSKRKQSEAFEWLRPFLTSKAGGDDAENAARALGISVSELHVRVHRFGKECGEFLRQEVARTVDAPHEIDAELRYLVDLLSQSKWSS